MRVVRLQPQRFSEFISGRPLTPSLSPSDGEGVAEGRVRGSHHFIRKLFLRTTLVQPVDRVYFLRFPGASLDNVFTAFAQVAVMSGQVLMVTPMSLSNPSRSP